MEKRGEERKEAKKGTREVEKEGARESKVRLRLESAAQAPSARRGQLDSGSG